MGGLALPMNGVDGLDPELKLNSSQVGHFKGQSHEISNSGVFIKRLPAFHNLKYIRKRQQNLPKYFWFHISKDTAES
jgi:hypothetical protein